MNQEWRTFTLEYSKTFTKNGKKCMARQKKKLTIDPKRGLFTWVDRDGNKKGSKNIEQAISSMAGDREPIESYAWNQVENQKEAQSLYVAGGSGY